MVMAKEHTKVIDGVASIKSALEWVYHLVTKGLDGGAVEIAIRRYEEGRSNTQNAKQWAMYTDISEQLQWHGNSMSKEDWKILLTNEWKPQSIVPSIGGSGFCVLNASTSKASKKDMADLIEIVYAFGSSSGVKWSEQSLAAYESYREAQQ
jgi:hypothetical protein